ncbi:N-acetyltransferase [Corallincola luteus]|uniref:N-acetyltransferase n=2 Tax=Corallincola TaxID=1775176 RepID=A0A368NL69_9GAMM|nr:MULTISPECIES: GNAT family N-acetyltransferase [Corallincola]RCU50906.1 N-acetyltransferase [Corallincola holothuriorum]TCI03957.1 N-acetyltransferase [Corallincola luteus]
MGTLCCSTRINYHPVNEQHLHALVALDSDPEVMRYINGGNPTPVQHYRERVLPRWQALAERASHLGFFVMEHQEDGRILGWVHNRPFVDAKGDETGELELGYRLFRCEWGQGYAKEAAAWVLNNSKQRKEASKLVAIAMPDNLASIAVMRHVGMSKEHSYTHATGVEVVKYSCQLD